MAVPEEAGRVLVTTVRRIHVKMMVSIRFQPFSSSARGIAEAIKEIDRKKAVQGNSYRRTEKSARLRNFLGNPGK
jgi:hypothetical protein